MKLHLRRYDIDGPDHECEDGEWVSYWDLLEFLRLGGTIEDLD